MVISHVSRCQLEDAQNPSKVANYFSRGAKMESVEFGRDIFHTRAKLENRKIQGQVKLVHKGRVLRSTEEPVDGVNTRFLSLCTSFILRPRILKE